jgi:hypothetical protein
MGRLGRMERVIRPKTWYITLSLSCMYTAHVVIHTPLSIKSGLGERPDPHDRVDAMVWGISYLGFNA